MLKFVRLSPWCESDRAWGLDYLLQLYGTRFSLYGSVIDYLLCTDSMRENFEQNTCKGGRQELEHSGKIIYHWGRDEDDKLASQSVSGWWVVGGTSKKATGITNWRGDLMLCWFDSQV